MRSAIKSREYKQSYEEDAGWEEASQAAVDIDLK